MLFKKTAENIEHFLAGAGIDNVQFLNLFTTSKWHALPINNIDTKLRAIRVVLRL